MADEEKPVPAAESDSPTVIVEAVPEDIPPPPGPVAPRRRGGFVAPLIGGALAGVIGFGLSHYNVLNLRGEIDPQATEARFAALEAALQKTEAAAATAAGRADEAAIQAQTGAQEAKAQVAGFAERLEALDAALAALQQAAPDGSVPPAAFAALRAEVDALKAAPSAGGMDAESARSLIQQELDARAAEVTARAEAEAEALRAEARRDAAMLSLREAVANGQPYAGALADLGLADVPAPLAAHAETGLPTAAGLADAFPEAARAALESSLRADADDSFGDRAWSLLRIGTGARSLTPREGTDPDAVLSRAEAAAKAGDLPLALQELAGLPEAGRAEMADWISQAQSRIAADAALSALQ
ncbi:COG4223 family protein [Pseudogemmobacter humi]|uniref:Mitochondrial inner membrane protein n=1 Tax=Pseudogemmobacter humi TaxID=2483812 RepID=A0A3P5WT52_9RHOB|nr:hypothetical protein [Pseudogemmobacter humi]VDC19144.1 hypothetical protein XINFAN_00089 [Pseudogemmobacter humi]